MFYRSNESVGDLVEDDEVLLLLEKSNRKGHHWYMSANGIVVELETKYEVYNL